MSDLFGDLPEQSPPSVLVVGNHALIKCGTCGGTGEGELKWPDIVIPCRHCNGGGVRLIAALWRKRHHAGRDCQPPSRYIPLAAWPRTIGGRWGVAVVLGAVASRMIRRVGSRLTECCLIAAVVLGLCLSVTSVGIVAGKEVAQPEFVSRDHGSRRQSPHSCLAIGYLPVYVPPNGSLVQRRVLWRGIRDADKNGHNRQGGHRPSSGMLVYAPQGFVNVSQRSSITSVPDVGSPWDNHPPRLDQGRNVFGMSIVTGPLQSVSRAVVKERIGVELHREICAECRGVSKVLGGYANCNVLSVDLRRQVGDDFNPESQPSSIAGDQSVFQDSCLLSGLIGLPASFVKTASSKDGGENGCAGYTNVQGLCVTPIKLLVCAVLFFGGMFVVVISLTRWLKFGSLWLLLGAAVAILSGVFALPL